MHRHYSEFLFLVRITLTCFLLRPNEVCAVQENILDYNINPFVRTEWNGMDQ
jgi:hypothetical protein